MLLADRNSNKRDFQLSELARSPCERLRSPQSQCAIRKPDAEVLDEMGQWMTRGLRCVAGRREYVRGRYMIRIASKGTVAAIFDEFKTLLARGEAVACLLVFNDARFYKGRSNTSAAFRFLAEQMTAISDQSAASLANGGSLTNAIELRCPVTNQLTMFDDFECIAFCPQSAERADPLYDPLMAAKYTSVNISSDVYAFSRFVSDCAMTAWNKPVHAETDIERMAGLFKICVDRWQRVAMATIRGFEAVTDTAVCPVHVTRDQAHWVAAHKDPAFAEQEKETHRHELPILYATRITERWLRYFAEKKTYDASGLARAGIPLRSGIN